MTVSWDDYTPGDLDRDTAQVEALERDEQVRAEEQEDRDRLEAHE